ncbi:class F sortase [Streptomyces sannanensis]|uniref:class F sortase n=1 Tax=Streptomyces sannanensis TaxID=285536 RepID=UPI003CD0722B
MRGKAGLVAIAVCTGIWLIRTGSDMDLPPQPATTEAFARAAVAAEPDAGIPLPPSDPVRIRIPAIRVDAPVTRLGLRAGGSLEAPPAGNRNLAGWYRGGPAPGAKGASIIAGHVDTAEGPAVFYNLGTLKKGTRIEITRKDGRTAAFAVDAVEVFDNNAFPDRKVYGATVRPELRVITCGGGFDARTGYQANVVAFAHLTGEA